ncbi:MAG: hypothetical protein GXO66_09105 [Euryarchaeota archaeon]|nr:hypothetical protein [Euryarchaeota archaeon]
MLVISSDSEDSLARVGAGHFAEKYGIPFRVRVGDGIRLEYGESSREVFCIRLHGGSIEDEVRGEVRWKGGRVPVFEEPGVPGSGRALAFCGESPCAVLNGKSIEVGVDVFREVGYLLTGGLDKALAGVGREERERILATPVADLLEEFLFHLLLLACREAKLPLVTKPFWPQDYRFAVCLTHDVDEVRKTYQWLTWPLRRVRAGDFAYLKHQLLSLAERLRGREPFWTFERIMELEEELGVRSTFYFLQESGEVHLTSPASWKLYARKYDIEDENLRAVMKRLREGGWEVGLHGSYHSFEREELLSREKSKLEAVLGDKVHGIRQHHGNLSIPLTWELQDSLGFACDTSLLLSDTSGFRWGTCFPFSPYSGERQLSLIEIPTTFMDTPYFMRGAAEAERRCRALMEEVRRRGGVLNLLFHHTVFNPNEFPGWMELYRRLVQRAKSMGAWVTTAGEIASWWRRRREWSFDVEFSDSGMEVSSERWRYLQVYHPEFCDLSTHILEKVGDSSVLLRVDNGSITIGLKNLQRVVG